MKWNDFIISMMVVLLVAALGIAYETFHPVSSKHVEQLTQECRAIHHPSTAEFIDSGTSKRPTSVSVYATFETLSSWDDVRQYYKTELPRNGWTYLMQEDKMVYYQKGEYKLELYYKGGEKKKHSYTYGVFLRWRESQN